MQEQPARAIQISWHFYASPDKVWRAWTEPEIINQWFGSDPNGTVLHAAVDAHPGGAFEITFANADGTTFTCFGVYKEVWFHQKLAFTWSWKSNPAIEEHVTVLLREESGGTQMDFEIADVDHHSAHDYETGWRSTFEKLGQAIEYTRS